MPGGVTLAHIETDMCAEGGLGGWGVSTIFVGEKLNYQAWYIAVFKGNDALAHTIVVFKITFQAPRRQCEVTIASYLSMVR